MSCPATAQGLSVPARAAPALTKRLTPILQKVDLWGGETGLRLH
jgi:hypothetical protein